MLCVAHAVCDNGGQLSGNPGKENIRPGCCVVPGSSPGSTHIDLEMVDGPFHNDPYLYRGKTIRWNPVGCLGTCGRCFIRVSGELFFRRVAGLPAVADPHCPFAMLPWG